MWCHPIYPLAYFATKAFLELIIFGLTLMPSISNIQSIEFDGSPHLDFLKLSSRVSPLHDLLCCVLNFPNYTVAFAVFKTVTITAFLHLQRLAISLVLLNRSKIMIMSDIFGYYYSWLLIQLDFLTYLWQFDIFSFHKIRNT